MPVKIPLFELLDLYRLLVAPKTLLSRPHRASTTTRWWRNQHEERAEISRAVPVFERGDAVPEVDAMPVAAALSPRTPGRAPFSDARTGQHAAIRRGHPESSRRDPTDSSRLPRQGPHALEVRCIRARSKDGPADFVFTVCDNAAGVVRWQEQPRRIGGVAILERPSSATRQGQPGASGCWTSRPVGHQPAADTLASATARDRARRRVMSRTPHPQVRLGAGRGARPNAVAVLARLGSITSRWRRQQSPSWRGPRRRGVRGAWSRALLQFGQQGGAALPSPSSGACSLWPGAGAPRRPRPWPPVLAAPPGGVTQLANTTLREALVGVRVPRRVLARPSQKHGEQARAPVRAARLDAHRAVSAAEIPRTRTRSHACSAPPQGRAAHVLGGVGEIAHVGPCPRRLKLSAL